MSILDMANPRLAANNVSVGLEGLGSDLYSFSLILANENSTPEVIIQPAASTILWYL